MPEFTTIKDLGSFGVILIAFALLVWKGFPAFAAWLRDLLVLFKAEIQKERDYGATQLALEREFRARSDDQMAAALDRNTQSIDRNTAATQALQKAVEAMPKAQ